MAREVLLKIYEGERAKEEFIFNEPGAYLIGRSAQCALQIAKMRDKKISRGHLLFILGMSGVRIRDLGSRNGTFLNGVRMEPGEIGDVPEEMSAADSILNPGDRVTMGDTVWGIEFIIPELSQTKLKQASQKLQERKVSLIPSVSQATPPPQVLDVHPKKKPGPTISFASKLKKPEGPTVKKTSVSAPITLTPKQKTPGISSVAPHVKRKPSMSTISMDEERETDKNPPIEPKQSSTPIILKSKGKRTEASALVKAKTSLRSSSSKDAPSFDKDKVNSKSIAEQDVYDKLGTAEETVSMEPEEFENLDDLVIRPPGKSANKRTTNFKIKSPQA